ncbi:hypothetical protein ACFE04_014118 [Oxalis oulophora]
MEEYKYALIPKVDIVLKGVSKVVNTNSRTPKFVVLDFETKEVSIVTMGFPVGAEGLDYGEVAFTALEKIEAFISPLNAPEFSLVVEGVWEAKATIAKCKEKTITSGPQNPLETRVMAPSLKALRPCSSSILKSESNFCLSSTFFST